MKQLLGVALSAVLGLSIMQGALADELFVYSGAGLKKPMEEIAVLYNETHQDTDIVFNYAGSGQLLTQLETTLKGDVFLVGSEVAYNVAKAKGLVGDAYEISHHTPAIVVLKGNPKNVQTLEDLTREDIKVILGEEKASAIGKTAQEILKKNQLEAINDRVVSTANTVNEMVVQLTLGSADAMIATIDSVYMSPKVEVIEIDPAQNIDQIVTGGVVLNSAQASEATQFMEFVASEEGQAIFARYGFAPVQN